MPKHPSLICLLLTFFHSWVQTMKSGDKSEVSQNGTSCSQQKYDLKIYSPTPETTIRGNVTLECYSETSCLPIQWIIFLKKTRKMHHGTQKRMKDKVVFNFTINSTNELGEYKCKAESENWIKYSPGFNFTLKEGEKTNLVAFIVPPVVLLLLLVAAAVAVRLLILPWYKARKQRLANTSTLYDDIAYGKTEETEYCNVKIKCKTEDCRNVLISEDSTVNYAEIICR